MNLLNYHGLTGEYLNISVATQDPKHEGRFLKPANAVYAHIHPLPILSINEVAIWNGADWVVTADFRGTTYWLQNDTGTLIDGVNVLIPDGAATEPPPTLESILDGGVWREPNAQEVDDNLTAQSLELADAKKAFAAVIEMLWDNSAELQVAYATPADMKQDAIARYKAKLGE